MDTKNMPPRTIGIGAYPKMPDATDIAEAMAASLERRGVRPIRGSLNDSGLRRSIEAGEVDMLVALGGDGTMLRAGHLAAPAQVPVLGVNLGRVGFLIEVERDGWPVAIDRVLAGDYWIEPRMMLRASLSRAGKQLTGWDVLNEVVVGRGKTVRLVRLEVEIDGAFLTTYAADALIAATPTGSTAYALAAGGPILPPELRNILIVAVAPHFSIDRAVVLHEGSTIRITVRTDHQATLSVDGQSPMDIQDGDAVEVSAAEHSALFVRLQDPGYFYHNLTRRMSQNANPGAER
jgi:NAD+ kinase